MKSIAAVCVLGIMLVTGSSVAVECDSRNTSSFFETATPEVVSSCFQSGADPNARGEYERGPLHRAVALNQNPVVTPTLINGKGSRRGG